MNFLALDFETASARRDSICEVGIAHVANGEVVETRAWHVRPEPNYFAWQNTRIHGIDAAMVADAPTFGELWREIGPRFDGCTLIAHNASFDLSVLRHGLQGYGQPFPTLRYACTVQLARRAWPGQPSYSLGKIAPWLGIDLQHHSAASDARAAALLVLRAAEAHGAESFDALAAHFSLYTGRLFADGWVPPGNATPRRKSTELPTTDSAPGAADPSHPFYRRQVVFTGRARDLSRAEVQRRVRAVGGWCGERVTFDTHFLVMLGPSRPGRESAKARAAARYRAAGANIQVLSEGEFMARTP
ncbi:MAG: exonuclease domain-containing protein [Catalinimonas sp.]